MRPARPWRRCCDRATPQRQHRRSPHRARCRRCPAPQDRRCRAPRLKASGLERFPFTELEANAAWLATVGFAADLTRWFQLLCLTGPLAAAEPKTLCWRLWHTPARIIRKGRQDVIRLLDAWPDTDQILAAYQRIATLT
jgi:hypothetical protein